MTGFAPPILRAFAVRAALVLCAAAILAMSAPPARAMPIERVVSPGGIEAWLVRDRTVPLIAVHFAFLGGSSQDPAEKAGVANMVANLLDEGAGDLDAKAFRAALDERAIELSFTAGKDFFRGSLRTLKEHRAQAFELMRLALTAPRFDAGPVERVRTQIVVTLQREATNPSSIASRKWWQAAFPDHPYGRRTAGDLETVPRISAEDLKSFVRRNFGRDRLKIGVVGDIDAATLAATLDRVFGALPAKADLLDIPLARPQGLGRRIAVNFDVPQTVVTFGGPGIARNDADFMAAYIVNHILGGGSFSSRLYREVREKRGLAYSVYGSLVWYKHAALRYGSTATRTDRAVEAVDVIEQEIRRLAKDGPTPDEFEKAKSYLKGSFALGLDTSTKIATQLVQIQIDDLGIDYIDRRSSLIDAVTLEDARRVAKRLFDSGMLLSLVGRQVEVAPVQPAN
jgi:zinc protease